MTVFTTQSGIRIKTFVISLKSNQARRDLIMAQKDKIAVPFEIFDAITPDTMDVGMLSYDEGRARRFTGRGMMPTEKACALSHITLWRQLEQDGEADFYLICEDDIEVQTNLADLLNVMDFTGVGFVKLTGKQNRPLKKVNVITPDYDLVKFAYGPLDTASYLISKDKVGKIYDYCKTLKTPIDILMDRTYDHGVECYGVMPYPITADFCFDETSPLYSSIGERKKYADDITRWEKLCVKMHRLWGSVKRKIASLQLHLVKG